MIAQGFDLNSSTLQGRDKGFAGKCIRRASWQEPYSIEVGPRTFSIREVPFKTSPGRVLWGSFQIGKVLIKTCQIVRVLARGSPSYGHLRYRPIP
jgi:hypothetical protein